MRRLNSISALTALFLLSVSSAFAQTNIITTFAGGGSQNNIPGLVADLPSISGVAVDGAGNVYIASRLLHQVFKRNTSGQLFVVAGTGICGNEGDGGPAVSGSLCYPMGIALDASGNLFIVDSGNNRVRRVDASNQLMTTRWRATEAKAIAATAVRPPMPVCSVPTEWP
ncbi:MAG: hypothetical protein P4N24_15285 [Acidobacteriota bacterium]|nr:hypothetical protein [Acidobacteriota bacterium]